MVTPSVVRFAPSSASPFAAEVEERVAAYFRERGLSCKSNRAMHRKTAILWGWVLASYATVLAPGVPLKWMAGFLPLLWLSFAVNALTGTLLLMAYPTKQLTNPVFYVKVCLIALAVLIYEATINTSQNMRDRGIPTDFSFWNNVAGFDRHLVALVIDFDAEFRRGPRPR